MNLNTIDSSHFIYDWVYSQLTGWNIPAGSAHYLSAFVLVLVFAALLLVLQMLIRKVLVRFITRLSEKSKNQLDDHLMRNNALRNFARLVPVYISYQLVPVVFAHFPQWIPSAEKFLDIVLIISWVLAIRSVFRAVRDHLKTKDFYHIYREIALGIFNCYGRRFGGFNVGFQRYDSGVCGQHPGFHKRYGQGRRLD